MPDNNDQPQGEPASQTEVDDIAVLLGYDQADTEQVKPGAEPDKTDGEQEDQANTETDSDEEQTEDTPEESEEEEEKQTFKVAGREYDNYDDAVKAINSINGENTRLVGEVKSLNTNLQAKDSEIEKLRKTVEQWEKYGDDELDSPPEKLPKPEPKQEQETQDKQRRVEQYRSELELVRDTAPDYDDVYPKMRELALELGEDAMYIRPSKLYKMARQALGTVTSQSKQSPTKQRQEKAKKMIGGSGTKPSTKPKTDSEDDQSPEFAAVLGL